MGIQDGMNQCDFEIDSFLMMGQSNMAGRGNIGEVPKIENPLCFMLRMGRWQGMSEPINPDRCIFSTSPYRSGISLAASFADEYANCYQKKIGLIPCADGGTRLEQWMPREVLYDHAVMMTSLARRTSSLAGILWHQGESDCEPECFPTYAARCTHVLESLRRDLGAPEVPLILGGLGEYLANNLHDAFKNYVHINAQLQQMAKTLPCCGYAGAEGLASNPDNLHFSAKALREFGLRYYREFQRLCPELGEGVDADLSVSEIEKL